MSENTAAEQVFELSENGEFCWTELATGNLQACKTFYAEVFGWQFKQSEVTAGSFEYLEFGTEAGQPFGGMFEMKPEFYGGEMPKPHSNIYVAVTDVDETAGKAFDLGGTVLSPPEDMPGVGRFCQIKDPNGATFFIITLKQ